MAPRNEGQYGWRKGRSALMTLIDLDFQINKAAPLPTQSSKWKIVSLESGNTSCLHFMNAASVARSPHSDIAVIKTVISPLALETTILQSTHKRMKIPRLINYVTSVIPSPIRSIPFVINF